MDGAVVLAEELTEGPVSFRRLVDLSFLSGFMGTPCPPLLRTLWSVRGSLGREGLRDVRSWTFERYSSRISLSMQSADAPREELGRVRRWSDERAAAEAAKAFAEASAAHVEATDTYGPAQERAKDLTGQILEGLAVVADYAEAGDIQLLKEWLVRCLDQAVVINSNKLALAPAPQEMDGTSYKAWKIRQLEDEIERIEASAARDLEKYACAFRLAQGLQAAERALADISD